MFQTIFFDLDDTLLDFGAAETVAISKTFRDIGLDPTPALIARYKELNEAQWEAFERGELSREAVLLRRFSLLFAELRLPIEAAPTEDRYRAYLGQGHYFVDGAVEILEYLAPKYDLYLASNGVAATQYSRLESAGISHFFREIFISETTGHHKPERAYFDYCFSHIPHADRARTLMIGDSLSSDIRGGINAGIRTCWFNPHQKPATPSLRPDYEIQALSDLRKFL